MRTLPPFLNGNIQRLYNGAELRPLTTEDIQFVLDNLDAHYLLREEFSQKIKSEILDPFDILKHKLQILQPVALRLPDISVNNVSLALLFEDLCKFLSISIADITDKLIDLIKLITSQYICLFKKTSLKKLVEAFGNADSANKAHYSDLLGRHKQRTQEFFKFGLNEQGQPYSKNFEEIKSELIEKRKKINDYRDTVAAHVDLEKPIYLPRWEEIQHYIEYLENLICNLYFLGTYRGYGNPLEGPGIKGKETIEWFCQGFTQ
jgi:hypothetical protein